MMDTDFCVFLDAGHGGLDQQNRYVTAPSKQWQHSSGVFHNGRWFYEGVWNRILTDRVAAKLNNLRITNIVVSHEYVDLPLQYRVDVANWHRRNFRKTLFVSNHSNASGSGRARGFEIYTSPGRTGSDAVAEMYWDHVKDLLGSRIHMRSDTSDRDHDKEANFYVLRKTAMAAVLVEHLYFDNFDDASLLLDDEIVEYFAEAQVRTIIQYMKS